MNYKVGVTNRAADALSRRSSLLVTMCVEVPGFDSFHDLLTTDSYFSRIIQDVQDGQHDRLPRYLSESYCGAHIVALSCCQHSLRILSISHLWHLCTSCSLLDSVGS